MGKFRIRLGDRELEYEGEDSEGKYKEAFEWIRSLGIPSQLTPSSVELAVKRESKRGGKRQPVFASALRTLANDGFFKLPAKKNLEEVMKGVESKGLPVNGKEHAILEACRRLLKSDILKGTNTETGWQFWTE